MTDTTRRTSCPAGLDPAEVAAWTAEPDEHAGVARHIATCNVCGPLAEALRDVDGLAAALRAQTAVAPTGVTTRALGRIGLEAQAVVLLRTFLGGVARVAAAVPDYLHPRRGRP